MIHHLQTNQQQTENAEAPKQTARSTWRNRSDQPNSDGQARVLVAAKLDKNCAHLSAAPLVSTCRACCTTQSAHSHKSEPVSRRGNKNSQTICTATSCTHKIGPPVSHANANAGSSVEAGRANQRTRSRNATRAKQRKNADLLVGENVHDLALASRLVAALAELNWQQVRRSACTSAQQCTAKDLSRTQFTATQQQQQRTSNKFQHKKL
jgi:hypothetical protein